MRLIGGRAAAVRPPLGGRMGRLPAMLDIRLLLSWLNLSEG